VHALESLILIANLNVKGWSEGSSLNCIRVQKVPEVGISRSAQKVCSSISQFGAIVSLQKTVGY
jgi:hypothetical protein